MKQPKIQTLARLVAVLAVVGLVGLPVAASAATDTGTVRANVASVISVSSVNEVAISITPTSGAGAEAEASDTVTVDSNDGDGYDLTLSNADTSLTMTGYKDDNTTTNGSTLAAASGTYAVPAALGSNEWGYRVDSLGSFGASGTTYSAVPSSAAAQNIRSTTATANGQTTTVKYAAKVNLAVPNGVYRDTVTYTATAK